MSTLAIATWHANPRLLAEQINHYNVCFDGEITHVININSDFKESFWREANKNDIDFSSYPNLVFVDPPIKTYYAGVAHAFFVAVQEALRSNICFDHVYWHTSSDLLVRRGMNKYIKQYDVGFGKSQGTEFSYRIDHRGVTLPKFNVKDDASTWLSAISEDPKVADVLKAIGLTRLHKSRCEGSFFSRDVFFELMYPLISNMSVEDMASSPKPYPLEEYIFAQCVEFFCQRHDVKRAPHVVMTSKEVKSIASVDEIDAVIASGNKFGVKRFAEDINSPEREYVRKILGIGP